MHRIKGQRVSRWPKPTDLTHRNLGNVGHVPKRLARENIAQVQFDDRQFDRAYGVHESNRGMRISASVQDDPIMVAFGAVNEIDNRSFRIALLKPDLHAERFGFVLTRGFDVSDGGCPINVRLALAEQVEIWAVQNV